MRIERSRWPSLARPAQLISGEWKYWVLAVGRGWGKTESVLQEAVRQSLESPKRIAVVVSDSHVARWKIKEIADIAETSKVSMPEMCVHVGDSRIDVLTVKSMTRRGVDYDLIVCEDVDGWEDSGEAWDVIWTTIERGSESRLIITASFGYKGLQNDGMYHAVKAARMSGSVYVSGTSHENADNLSQMFPRRLERQPYAAV